MLLYVSQGEHSVQRMILRRLTDMQYTRTPLRVFALATYIQILIPLSECRLRERVCFQPLR